MEKNVIKIGEYIVIQKHNYKKLHKLNKPNSRITLGRDDINLGGIEGCPYFSVFKMIPGGKKGREFRLELVDEVVELKDEIDIKSSGLDNRNIVDDGRSQKLSKEEIEVLTNDGNKASDIVETLISNSNTFHNKTEYSQAKYLKKKEKKYFEYVQILRPNLRSIAEVMYRLDPGKIQNLRIDTISQVITLSNIQSEGNHLLYDSGSNGLLAAALLSSIGANTTGKLIHMHPGNMSQKQALLAMNLPEEQYNRCISVNLYSALRQHYQGNSNNEKLSLNLQSNGDEDSSTKLQSKIEEDIKPQTKIEEDVKPDSTEHNKLKRKANEEDTHSHKTPRLDNCANDTENNDLNKKTQNEPKKPRWHYDNITAAELLSNKMDSLIIACKEDPQNIFMELLPFMKPSRPFVVYYPVAEPLQNLYVTLKCLSNVAALKLTCNWMRNYQILPERTHPEVLMNGQSGFLLTGYILK